VDWNVCRTIPDASAAVIVAVWPEADWIKRRSC
jgi:hypothetical protein